MTKEHCPKEIDLQDKLVQFLFPQLEFMLPTEEEMETFNQQHGLIEADVQGGLNTFDITQTPEAFKDTRCSGKTDCEIRPEEFVQDDDYDMVDDG